MALLLLLGLTISYWIGDSLGERLSWLVRSEPWTLGFLFGILFQVLFIYTVTLL